MLVFLYVGTAQPANAIFCANCKQIWQGFMEYAMQGYELAKGTLTSISSGTTALQQTVSTLNQTVFRPLQDAMMLMSMVKSGNMIKNLVLGGVGGETSLLIQNPERYIKQKGVESLKLSVGSVVKADGIYSDSILDAVVSQARTASDVKGRLTSLSKSNIPQMVQDSFCEDSKLEETALNDVRSENLEYTDQDVLTRKEELYTKLCLGDPNTDKTLSQALTDVANQTDGGGWEVFLAKTNGDNNFTRTSQALTVIEEEKIKREASKAADLARGNGIVSKTECLVKIKNEATGVDDCAEESITNAGYQLSEAYKEAIQAPLKTLISSYGSGGTFSSLLSNIGGIINSVNSIKSSINSVSGSISALDSSAAEGGDRSLQINVTRGSTGTGNSGSGSQTTSGNNSGALTNTTTNNSTSFTQDLAGNVEGKKAITKAIKTQLDLHTKALVVLEKSDKDYLSELDIYTGHIENVGACYQQLVRNFPDETIGTATFASIANDSRVVNGLSYYSNQKVTTNNLKIEITKELSLVEETSNLVGNTLNIITNSNSTDEISATFEEYNDTVENNNLPSVTSGTTREGDIISLRTKREDETRDLTGTEGAENFNGIITKLKKECTAIGQDESAKREAARAAAGVGSSVGI